MSAVLLQRDKIGDLDPLVIIEVLKLSNFSLTVCEVFFEGVKSSVHRYENRILEVEAIHPDLFERSWLAHVHIDYGF